MQSFVEKFDLARAALDLHKKQNEIFTHWIGSYLSRRFVPLFAKFLSLLAYLFAIYDSGCTKTWRTERGMDGVEAICKMPSMGRTRT